MGSAEGLDKFLLIEIKKNKMRGGHFHNIDTYHFVLLGKVEYHEVPTHQDSSHDVVEQVQIIDAGNVIHTPAFAAHMIRAIDYSIIVEPTDKAKETINFQPYRRLVESNK